MMAGVPLKTPISPTVTVHTGGMLSSSRRRMHIGGTAGNEVNATLLAGEGVLNKRGMSALSSLNRGQAPSGAGGDTYIIVNAIDTESFRERLARHGDIYEASAIGGMGRNSEIRRKLRSLM